MSVYVLIKKTRLSPSRHKEKKSIKGECAEISSRLRCEKRRIMAIIERRLEAREKKATMSKKFRGHCHQNLF